MILTVIQALSGCYSCQCDKADGLDGFYICDRKSSQNQEFLWLFTNNTYVHVLVYDTVQYVNSDTWSVREDLNSKSKLFIAQNWVAPCESGRIYCSERMDYVAKHNFNRYKGSNAQLGYGCSTIGLDASCHFRLSDQLEPMYNYKRVADEEIKSLLGDRTTRFYSVADSTHFVAIIATNR